MKLYNINHDHVTSHRIGWDNTIEQTIEKTIENMDFNIGLIDFIDKYFDPWLHVPKIIICENIKYHCINKDAYYYKEFPYGLGVEDMGMKTPLCLKLS